MVKDAPLSANRQLSNAPMLTQTAMSTEMFGRHTFGQVEMKERLPKAIFKELLSVINGEAALTLQVADVVASGMRDWALEKGATHFCHWFQPLSGETAEKHDSFLNPSGSGKAVMEFSGKELCQGEPDASSFPNGSLRSTFEARGYTAWDPTSPVFIKQDGTNRTLFIPSAFCSYTGHALDAKTPLLRSMEALNKAALRVLRAFGDNQVGRVVATMGAEQEYFLIDRAVFDQRLDLTLTGRTLFGAPSPKGQEMEDHYFGHLHERVASFMHELNHELWALGIFAKTQHNEVAPSQYELAPVFSTINVAADQNAIVMETLEKIAARHSFVCLLHEKPFAGVNGSGKHNNWSLGTDTGVNLLEPGKTPHDNAVFLTFLCAVVRAVDKYCEILRASVANASNDHRLGANEAPPAIISVFLGAQLQDIMEQLAKGVATSSVQGSSMVLGVSSLPALAKDTTDRNRTSPFAFTGNKFEFRMPGSSQSIANPCMTINVIVADILNEFADKMQSCKDVAAVQKCAQELCTMVAKENTRVVMNGNNYGDEWKAEAARRGLPNLFSTPLAYKRMMDEKNILVFERTKTLSRAELHARVDIMTETYIKSINIEALTMIRMAKTLIRPAAIKAAGEVARATSALKDIGVKSASSTKLCTEMAALLDKMDASINSLEANQKKMSAIGGDKLFEAADMCRDVLIPDMEELRASADALESMCSEESWPIPSYATMLFVKQN